MASGVLLLLKNLVIFHCSRKEAFFSFTIKNVSCLSNVGGEVFLPILIES